VQASHSEICPRSDWPAQQAQRVSASLVTATGSASRTMRLARSAQPPDLLHPRPLRTTSTCTPHGRRPCGGARRALAAAQAEPGRFGEEAAAGASAAAGPAAALQERLLGRGVFRRFLEAHVARGAEHYEACASAGFLAAAGGVLRCRAPRRRKRRIGVLPP